MISVAGAIIWLQQMAVLDIDSGVNSIGSIKVYEDAECTTELTTFSMGLFTETQQTLSKAIWVKNMGNVAINFTFVMSDSSLDWTVSGVGRYEHYRETIRIYLMDIPYNASYMCPEDHATPTVIPMAYLEVVPLSIQLRLSTIPPIPELFTVQLTFTAKEA